MPAQGLCTHYEDFEMKATTNKAVFNSAICLDAIPMNAYERRRANASMRQGELFADFVLGAAADIAVVAHAIEHAVASVAHAIRALLAKPVKH